jgi:hypothetical protein
MLCQLVCVDRRYQRMNCFNIRELQGILKRKFFNDLINTSDHRLFLDKTALGLRFKSNLLNPQQTDQTLFYNLSTSFLPKIKQNSLYQPQILQPKTSLSGASAAAQNLIYIPEINKISGSVTDQLITTIHECIVFVCATAAPTHHVVAHLTPKQLPNL